MLRSVDCAGEGAAAKLLRRRLRVVDDQVLERRANLVGEPVPRHATRPRVHRDLHDLEVQAYGKAAEHRDPVEQLGDARIGHGARMQRHLVGDMSHQYGRVTFVTLRGGLYLPGASPRRLASNRYQTRFSVSSIQTSSRLAVATSPRSSHTPCASRMCAARRWLSSRNSASMSSGLTYSASLSRTRCSFPIWPIERIVPPPSLRTRSAVLSVI